MNHVRLGYGLLANNVYEASVFGSYYGIARVAEFMLATRMPPIKLRLMDEIYDE